MKTLSEFIEAYGRVQYWWHALDEPILCLCSRHPTHQDPRVVFGKVALVNRAYRANLQMGTRNAEWKLAEALVKARVDDALARLRGCSSLSDESLPAVLDAHLRLVEIAKEATGRVTKSFCSKYLSFHFPGVVPLFDTLAETSAKRLPVQAPPRSAEPNARYRAHCTRVLQLVRALRAAGIDEPSLKLLDYVLYNPDAQEGQA